VATAIARPIRSACWTRCSIAAGVLVLLAATDLPDLDGTATTVSA